MSAIIKYEFTDRMEEISGFGGNYEQFCRNMVIAGLEWLDNNPDAAPRFKGCENVFGLIYEDNPDGEQLTLAMQAVCPDCTGAMMHACITHVLYINKNGWENYVREMEAAKNNSNRG